MQAEDAAGEREADVGLGLAHAGEDALRDTAARREHATQFAAADEIEGGAKIREVTEHGEIGVGLERVANAQVESVEAAGESAVVIRNRAGAVDVGRRAVELSDGREIDGLAMQILAGVMEVVHGWIK